MKIGSHYLGGGRCEFVVWSPLSPSISLQIVSPVRRTIPMNRDPSGYWRMILDDIYPGSYYFYHIDSLGDRPDPASNSQPRGVHGPSQIVDHRSFIWQDIDWICPDQSELILYELHVGTFSSAGTFEGVISHLDTLLDLGVNALAIMPVAQFPGDRNWGYDGVYPFAPQNTYGGPDGLKFFVDACHAKGIAVILDVVYSHLGLEGNYLSDFGRYFIEKYHTPWGMAINFDDAFSDDVRNYFIENALYWLREFHIDGLRLDAVHEMYDMSPLPFLRELSIKVIEFGNRMERKYFLVADNDRAGIRPIIPCANGGFGFDIQMCEDFHNSLYALIDVNHKQYYLDFGTPEHLVKAIKEGNVYSGQYSQYRRMRHGESSASIPGSQLIVFNQDHARIGNVYKGKRISELVPFSALKLSAGLLLSSPFIPQLFMGEEYGTAAPFHFFISHSDEELIKVVREGRRREYYEDATAWVDPQSDELFLQSKLPWDTFSVLISLHLFGFYRRLIQLRKQIPALAFLEKNNLEITTVGQGSLLLISRSLGNSAIFIIANISPGKVVEQIDFPAGSWHKILDSDDLEWGGAGSSFLDIVSGRHLFPVDGYAFVLYEKQPD